MSKLIREVCLTIALIGITTAAVRWLTLARATEPKTGDRIRDLQTSAMESGKAEWGHWGINPEKYSDWKSHSSRLIPVYTFGVSLDSVIGETSVYRDAERLKKLYGSLPEGTVNPAATYCDQTDVYRLQKAAVDAGKTFIVLIVFDGLDWQLTRAAGTFRSGKVAKPEGRGAGLHFQDYRGVATDFGYFATGPHNDGTRTDVNAQTVMNPGGLKPGGYDWQRGGGVPWAKPTEPEYLLGRSRARPHPYTDSASSATSLTAGIKTYNGAINVDAQGEQVVPIARWLQETRGLATGVVTSVPISHATPATAYANNVSRSDYQDLSRDLLGLPSVAHRDRPLRGVDVLLGCGLGIATTRDPMQGDNFVQGNRYITVSDFKSIDHQNGGRYVVAMRTKNQNGGEALQRAAKEAAKKDLRLFGIFGVRRGNLPYQTADGNYNPTIDVQPAVPYSKADIDENPTLAQMTRAALTVLEKNDKGFWLMIEAGDVDWASHDNNIDNAIGAVLSGDEAFRAVTQWAEANKCWDKTAVIVTADHGHYFVLREPEALIESQ